MNNIKSIILAAGQGTRMKSDIPKVLHKIFDKTMLDYVIDTAYESGISEICAVIGHKNDMVKETIGDRIEYAVQSEQLGTGHAVMQAENFISSDGNTLILYGDTPLIKAETIKSLEEFHNKSENAVTVVSVIVDNPEGYGHILRNFNGGFEKIIEHRDSDDKQKMINEINTGIYMFKSSELKEALKLINNNNFQKEYYLTDTLEIIKNKGLKTGVMIAKDESEFLGVNNRLQLSNVTEIMKKQINEKLMLNGVTIVDSNNTYIGKDVKIDIDTIIYPGTVIEGKTKIGKNCIIGSYNRIINSLISDNVTVHNSTVIESEIGAFTNIGPYAYLRPNSKIGEYARIGDFVEIKNSTIDNNTKVSHLTYVGDSDVGKNCNFGCGTVTVNYDGKNKYRTTIGDNVFIGCNSNLVAPVKLENNSYTAAGSTITHTVPEDSLSIARTKQIDKIGWRKKMNK